MLKFSIICALIATASAGKKIAYNLVNWKYRFDIVNDWQIHKISSRNESQQRGDFAEKKFCVFLIGKFPVVFIFSAVRLLTKKLKKINLKELVRFGDVTL